MPPVTRAKERLEARISREQKQLLQEAASLRGQSLTDFVISSAQDAARRTIEEWQVFSLSRRDREAFVYFYIRDEVLGPMMLCVGSFLPFHITYYLNGHHFIERELLRLGLRFRKDDNAFLATADPTALQAAADRLSPTIIRQRLEHWTWTVGRSSPREIAPRST